MITMGGGRSPCNWRISCAALRPSRSGSAPIHQHHVVATALGHRRSWTSRHLALPLPTQSARQPRAPTVR